MYIMWELRRRGGGGGGGVGGDSSSSSSNAASGAADPSNNNAEAHQNNNDRPDSFLLRGSSHHHHQQQHPPAPPTSSEKKRSSFSFQHHRRPSQFLLPIRRLFHQTHPRNTRRPVLAMVVFVVAVAFLWWFHSRRTSKYPSHQQSRSNADSRDSASNLPYYHRIVNFQYVDENDARRITGVAKIRKFQKEWNLTDALPAYAMTSTKFLRNLNKSNDYAQLGEPMETQDCIARYNWQTAVYPTCNTMHEFADLTHLSDGLDDATVVTKLLANGFWRDVWVVTDDHGVRVVKTLRYKHRLNLRNYDRNRRDAMALEHLTSSKYVVDIYGYCSAAGLFEYSNGGDVANAIWPGGFTPSLTPLRKLHIATQGAMALSSVHNFDQVGLASIAHTDIGPDQFIAIDGRYKLNDFNRCRFLLKNKTNEALNCPYYVNKNPGKNRSPEEYRYSPQTEKVDVYSFGNILYSLLQEELPFQDRKMKDVPDLVMEGVRPSIYYDVWNSTDPIVQALKEAMIMCHEGDPDERASALELETFLKQKLEEHDPGRLQEWGDAPP